MRGRFDDWIQDLRFALRSHRNAPGFTVAAVIVLALGIGVNAAVFTVTNAVLFKGFRFVQHNDRVLYIHSEKNGQYSGVSYPDFQDWRAQAESFDGIGAVAFKRVTLSDESGFPASYTATLISADGFGGLGQRPILGRDFTASDEIPGAPPVAILTYRFWERWYGKDAAIIGRTLKISGEPAVTVIGVMPEGFSFPQNQDLWMPLVPTPDLQRRDNRSIWFAFGRLAEGVTRKNARVEMEVIGKRLADTFPRTNQDQIPSLNSFTEFFIGPSARTVYVAMWGAVAFVLLIVCANLANLLLARAARRSREIALRIALGASRTRIIRQLLMEALLLSSVGAILGWGIANLGVRAYSVAADAPTGEWRHNLVTYAMDYRVLAYVTVISIAAGFLFGLAPALQFSRLNLNTILKQEGRGATVSEQRKHLSSVLVISEVALAVMLLAGAGVMIRSFLNLYTADLGIRSADMYSLFLNLENKYPSREAEISFFDRLKTRLETIPGVESTSVAVTPLAVAAVQRPYELFGVAPGDPQNLPTTAFVTIGPDYFATLGATMLTGREFHDIDGPAGMPAVVVNQRFAADHWRGEDPIGKRIRLFEGSAPGAWLTVVGVAPNIVHDQYRQKKQPFVYLPYRQRTSSTGGMWVLIRTALPTSEVVNNVRREISALDRDLPIWMGPYRLAELLAQGPYRNIRNHTVLFLIFGAIALLIASIGLYAVVAHSVSQRIPEIGIRMAIGATARDILRLVFKTGMIPVHIGLVVGLVASFGINRALASELVQVSPADPAVLVISGALLLLSGILGCWIPARRAVRVDPLVALRHD